MKIASSIIIITFIFSSVAISMINGFSFQSNNNNNNNPSSSTTATNTMERSTFLHNIMAITTIPSILATYPTTVSASTPTSSDLPFKAPYFDLPNASNQGSNVNIDTLTKTGKWTVLYFYPGAFTSGCTLEARGFQRDLNDYKALNTQIVGVSVDSVEKNAQFCSEEKLDFMLLTDQDGKVSKAYGSALSIPGFGTFSNRQTYLIDPNGDVQFVFTDVESRVAKHSSDVLEKLKELQT